MFVFESKVPSLAFLEFKVKDHCKSGTDEDIAMFSAPLSLIKEGTLPHCPRIDLNKRSLPRPKTTTS